METFERGIAILLFLSGVLILLGRSREVNSLPARVRSG